MTRSLLVIVVVVVVFVIMLPFDVLCVSELRRLKKPKLKNEFVFMNMFWS